MTAAPELAADLISEIILRLPPADPTCLVRASLVCKLWRDIISNPTFPRRYSAFHRTPPVLGFFLTLLCGSAGPIPRFVPITEPSPFPQPGPDFRGWQVIDCRDGRVLLDHISSLRFAVWDPITGHREELVNAAVPGWTYYAAAVVCGDQSPGGPFLVVLVYAEYMAGLTRARVFSSTTGAWGAPASANSGCAEDNLKRRGSVTIGDAIYFILERSAKMFRYDIGKHGLSAIDPPDSWYGSSSVLMRMEDGVSLGLVGSINSSLHLWSRNVDPDGAARWVQCKVIELPKLIPVKSCPARV